MFLPCVVFGARRSSGRARVLSGRMSGRARTDLGVGKKLGWMGEW